MNLHLMPIYSPFTADLVCEINRWFPQNENTFIVRYSHPKTNGYQNCITDPKAFTVDYLNAHYEEYKTIFLHFLFLRPHQVAHLKEEAAKKIIWVVWGDDLYNLNIRNEKAKTISQFARNLLYTWSAHSALYKFQNKKAREKIRMFKAIGIGYAYDENKVRELYGDLPPVVYAPYFSQLGGIEAAQKMREKHLRKQTDTVNVLIGHSGFPFHNHEKSLKILSKFKDENIHINLVLSYGASEERVKSVSSLAIQLFGENKTTILTEMLPKEEYYDFLASIDIALFPFAHQSALGNARRLAFSGAKLYLDPNGALAKGFSEGGVSTENYFEIENQTWEQFCANNAIPSTDCPLFDVFNYMKNVKAWEKLLSADGNESDKIALDQ